MNMKESRLATAETTEHTPLRAISRATETTPNNAQAGAHSGARDSAAALCPSRKEVWLDRVVKSADWKLTNARPIKADIIIAGAAPLTVMLIYMCASVVRAFALFVTPLAMLSPLFPLYRSEWSGSTKFVASSVYAGMMMMLNTVGVVSFPLYFILEAVPQLVTTTFYLMVFTPGLVLVGVALTLCHKFMN